MKHLLIALLFVAPSIYAQHNFDNLVDEKKADELLAKLRAKQATEDERNELQKIAISIQNKAQNQNENQRDFKKNLAGTDKAIVLFDALDDTLNVANNRKYKGYLLGRAGKFAEAKNETKAAIQLYQLKQLYAGVAVSEFDLARMFEFESKLDSAIYHASQSLNYWKSKAVDLRVVIIDNMLVSIYLKQNQAEKAKAIQEEAALLIGKPDMHWQAILDFYFTSMLLYKTINNVTMAGDYQQLYLSKIASLRNTGINAKSYYEHDRE